MASHLCVHDWLSVKFNENYESVQLNGSNSLLTKMVLLKLFGPLVIYSVLFFERLFNSPVNGILPIHVYILLSCVSL